MFEQRYLAIPAAVAWLLLAQRASRQYHKLPSLPVGPAEGRLPALTIIIPARNEAENLLRTLPTLMMIRYPGAWELIVVDDSSNDDTAQVAKSFGARVIRLDSLPDGWLGKPHACHQGALQAAGNWLLFTDADVSHTPNGPACAVRYAQQHCLDGLSLFLAHRSTNTLESMVLMTAYAGLFAGLPRLDGLLNGQYILLRQEAYHASGGFSAVRSAKLEDMALGNRLLRLGYRVPALRGENAAQVQMYTRQADLWNGMTRIGQGTLRYLRAGALLTAAFVTLTVEPLAMLAGKGNRKTRIKRSALSWLAVSAGFIPWAQRLGSPWLALFAPLGAAITILAAVAGLAQKLLGIGVHWKGRRV